MPNVAEAEDAVQDATTRAWRALRSLRDPDKLESWFHKIVVNESKRRLGSPWRRVLPSGLRLGEPRQNRDATDRRDEGDVVRAALLGLDADQRAVLVLRHYHDLPLEQIAAELHIPLGTVKSRLSRGSAELRHALTALEAST